MRSRFAMSNAEKKIEIWNKTTQTIVLCARLWMMDAPSAKSYQRNI